MAAPQLQIITFENRILGLDNGKKTRDNSVFFDYYKVSCSCISIIDNKYRITLVDNESTNIEHILEFEIQPIVNILNIIINITKFQANTITYIESDNIDFIILFNILLFVLSDLYNNQNMTTTIKISPNVFDINIYVYFIEFIQLRGYSIENLDTNANINNINIYKKFLIDIGFTKSHDSRNSRNTFNYSFYYINNLHNLRNHVTRYTKFTYRDFKLFNNGELIHYRTFLTNIFNVISRKFLYILTHELLFQRNPDDNNFTITIDYNSFQQRRNTDFQLPDENIPTINGNSIFYWLGYRPGAEDETNMESGGNGKYKYKKRSYKIRFGKRGGKYIIVNGKKIYI